MNEICLSCRKHTKCGRAEHETIGCGYYVPLTEQEYIQSCDTEQLVEELLAWWTDGANTYSHFGLFQHEIDGAKEKIVKWLKEKHDGNMGRNP